MKSYLRHKRLATFAITTGLALLAGLPAFGSISYTCAGSIDTTQAGTCAFLNGTIAGLYSSTFTNADARIYIAYGVTGLASSQQYYTNASYTNYVNALTSHESGANDVTAVGSLGGNTNNPVVSGDGVALTSALATALGLAGSVSSFGIIEGAASGNGGTCTLGIGNVNCYNGFVTVTNAANTWYYRSLTAGGQPAGTYDFFTAVQHETDEVLGTSSCISGNGTTSAGCTNGLLGNPSAAVGAGDLFRFTTPGGRSYATNANGQLAYFSINDGTTNIASYNNSPNGADYGDWDSALNRVQNAFGTPSTNGVNITNDGNSEIALLDAVGYNLASGTPEPATVTLLGAGFAFLAAYRLRRRA